MVTCDPEVSKTPRQQNDQFLMLACDGIWDCLTSEEGAELMRNSLNKKGNNEGPKKIWKLAKALFVQRGCFFTFPNNASLLRKYHNCSSPKEYNTNNSVRKIPKRNPEQIRIQMMRGRRRPPGKGRLIWMQCTITLHTRHLPFLVNFFWFFSLYDELDTVWQK